MKTFLLLSVCLLASQFSCNLASADLVLPKSVPSALPTSLTPPDSATGGLSGTIKTQAQKLKVNLNTASKEDIAKLPGIGPVKADAIVAGRPYEKPADVMKVKGIKQGVYNKIKGLISVN